MTTADEHILCRMTVSLQAGDGKTLRVGWLYWLLASDPDVQRWLAHDPPWAIHEVELEAEADAADAAEEGPEPVGDAPEPPPILSQEEFVQMLDDAAAEVAAREDAREWLDEPVSSWLNPTEADLALNNDHEDDGA